MKKFIIDISTNEEANCSLQGYFLSKVPFTQESMFVSINRVIKRLIK